MSPWKRGDIVKVKLFILPIQCIQKFFFLQWSASLTENQGFHKALSSASGSLNSCHPRAPQQQPRGAGDDSQPTGGSTARTKVCPSACYPAHRWPRLLLAPLVHAAGSPSSLKGTFVNEWKPNFCYWEEDKNEGHLMPP